MTENEDGGQVFFNCNLHWAWDAGEDAMRRMVAVKLWNTNAAQVAEIAAGFGVTEDTLLRWHCTVDGEGFTALGSSKRASRAVRSSPPRSLPASTS